MTANVCVVAASSSMISTRSCRDSMTVTIAGDERRSQVQYRDKVGGFAHFLTAACADRAHARLTGCVLIIHTLWDEALSSQTSAFSQSIRWRADEAGDCSRDIAGHRRNLGSRATESGAS